MNTKSRILTTFLFLMVFLVPINSLAEDKYWVGGSGFWDDASNWNAYGTPQATDKIFITQSDDINRTITNTTNAYIGSFVMGATGTGTITLTGGGVINAGYEFGGVHFTGGIVNLSGAYIQEWTGRGISVDGILNISSGMLSGSEWSSLQVSGTVNQTGGDVMNDLLDLSGIYNLSNGGLGCNTGDTISGVFKQTGGYHASGVGGSSVQQGGTYDMRGGDFQTTRITNSGTFNYSGGVIDLPGPGLIDNIVTNDGIFNLSGTGTRTVNADIINNGTFKTTNTTAVYTGSFTNNGTYISDPATQYFNDLVMGNTGYLVGQYNDIFYIGGDFINHSMMNTNWNTIQSYLGFITGSDNLHDFYLTGVDYGAVMRGFTNNFSWGTLDISGNILRLYDGDDLTGSALYLRDIMGLDISDSLITNLFGYDGLNVYYMANLKGNDYLGGLDYALAGGGSLKAIHGGVPEPTTMLLLGLGLIGLTGIRRKIKN